MTTRDRYPYQRIADDLRRDITNGTLSPGDQLPSEHALANSYKLTRATVVRALRTLLDDGLVISRRGAGWFVRTEPKHVLLHTGANYRKHRAAGLSGFTAQAAEQGYLGRQELLAVTAVPASEDVARRLGLAPGDHVVCRRRRFLLDGQPVKLCESYYPAEWAERTPLARHRLIKGGAHAVIEDPAGPIRRRIAYSRNAFNSRLATPAEAEQLQLRRPAAVTVLLNVFVDINDAPVEVQYTISTGHATFSYEVDMREDDVR